MTRSEPAGSRRRELWLAVGLMVLVTIHELWVLQLQYAPYFQRSVQRASALVVAMRVGGVLAIAAAQIYFFWSALVSSRRWQVAYWALFTAVMFLEYGWCSAEQRLTNAHDLDVILENTSHWGDMSKVFVDWRAAVPAGLFLAALAGSRPMLAGHVRRAITVFLALASLHSAFALRGFLSQRQDVGMAEGTPVPTGGFQAFVRASTMFVWNRAAAAIRYQVRDEVPYRSPLQPTQHVVLVIDESVSAGHISVNGYRRSTTPWLEELAAKRRLTNWGIASAATTYTTGSVLCVLTGVHVLPDENNASLRQSTIFQYAKAMNYETHLLDGQTTKRPFGLSWDDLEFVDDYRTADSFGNDADVDFRIGRAVNALLEMPRGHFVVILKRGNHYDHQNNYPPGRGKWRPSLDGPVSQGEADAALTNTYDNAILYNVDGFFRTLLHPDGSLPDAVVIYTSDHGEVLGGEDVRPLTRVHSWSNMAVPLMMFGDGRPAVDVGYRASHHNIFPTLLDLMSVPSSARKGSFARSLLTARATDQDPRFVLDGYIMGEETARLANFDLFRRPAVLDR